jgi:hypothetical protein
MIGVEEVVTLMTAFMVAFHMKVFFPSCVWIKRTYNLCYDFLHLPFTDMESNCGYAKVRNSGAQRSAF